jgi:uncharacterized membrane protein SirB2
MERYILNVAIFFLIMSVIVKVFESRVYLTSDGKNNIFRGNIKIVIMIFFFAHAGAFGLWFHDKFKVNIIQGHHIMGKILLAIILVVLAMIAFVVMEQSAANHKQRKKIRLKNC